MTRQHMTFVLQKFFAAFNRVFDEEEIKQQEETIPTQNHVQKKPLENGNVLDFSFIFMSTKLCNQSALAKFCAYKTSKNIRKKT